MTAAESLRREGRRQGLPQGRTIGRIEGRVMALVEAADELRRAGFDWPVIESATSINASSYRGLKGWISDSTGPASEPCITEDEAKLEETLREGSSARTPEHNVLAVFNFVSDRLRREGRLAGCREGRRKGRIEGLREGRLRAAEGLLRVGFDWPVIESATGIDEETCRGLKGESATDGEGSLPATVPPKTPVPAGDGPASPSHRTKSLRERILGAAAGAWQLRMYRRYGVLDNPFPVAGQPAGPPRLEDAADAAVAGRFRRFEEGGHVSQAVVIEGAPGAGKAALLDHYEEQFRDYCGGRGAYYVIRHQPAPAVSWLLYTILRSLDHMEKIGRKLALCGAAESREVKECAQSPDVRIVLDSLAHAAESDARLVQCARLARAWIAGRRVAERHHAALGVSSRLFRLDARMQALRDVVSVGARLRLVDGIVLLIDELEQPVYSLGRMPVLRSLVPVRELIEALPERLFLMMAMTPRARERYFALLPKLAGRLQDRIPLSPIMYPLEAERLSEFYVARAREAAQSSPMAAGEDQGASELFGAAEVKRIFRRLRDRSEARGTEGVTPRDFLHTLNQEWESRVRPDTAADE